MGRLSADTFVAESGWTLAKSMLQSPHQYTVRDLTTADARQTTAKGHAEFEWFARLIARDGSQNRWGAKSYIYLALGEWEYWTMGLAPELTTIINRRPISSDSIRLIERQVAHARVGSIEPPPLHVPGD